MTQLVDYTLAGDVATITMDDGKVNVLSPRMLSELNSALDCAEADGAVVLLTGRDGVFSAGFDLAVLRAGGQEALAMFRGGFELAARLLTFPAPVLAACTGHAIAMGAFLLLSVDHRIGVDGPFRIMANEVAIGVTVPLAGIEICRARLSAPHFSQAVTLAEVYSPAEAAEAGFLDRVVDSSELAAAITAAAGRCGQLDRRAHVATKLLARRTLTAAVTAAIEADFGNLHAA
jgi:enoyl-CoA hydratase